MAEFRNALLWRPHPGMQKETAVIHADEMLEKRAMSIRVSVMCAGGPYGENVQRIAQRESKVYGIDGLAALKHAAPPLSFPSDGLDRQT